ncbi:Rieske 2Fe-2S domain-containing protein [Halodesulfurarchaeum sp.]|uniref:Rieske 2Fe-2S domain-containing protein n=1 Tax=Halodesulfurarchaeum sp. TaxID=1980530 RepID=UPI001BC71204|nr:Rieske 2Fe-2S domain-containing protein [Halodesulfurarchaeum sp.]
MSSTDSTVTGDNGGSKNLLRRRIVQVFGGLGVVSFAGALLAPLKNLGIASGSSDSALPGQELILAEEYTPDGGTTTFETGANVTEDMLSTPGSTLAYPSNHVEENDYLVRVHRLPPNQIGGPTIEEMTANGYVAYSAVCTHLGCTVEWKTDETTPTGTPTDLCNCHGSQFDPYQGAEVVHPPADRALPQIGIELGNEGTLQLSSDFEERVGP